MDRPAKRAKVSSDSPKIDADDSPSATSNGNATLASLHRSITPPLSRSRQTSHQPSVQKSPKNYLNRDGKSAASSTVPQLLPSPIQLTHIRDLPASSGNNVDTVRLRDILGDPMIRECWQFNYLFDVDFLMNQFDEDVKNLVQVKIVHGSWKREAPNRIHIDEACSRYPNTEAVVAYMPEPFGTHHSKMMILLRHDNLAQVIIHTSNMIPMDWTNMSQAVWRSPLLPLLKHTDPPKQDITIGNGARFKRDLLSYLNAYGNSKTGPLIRQLSSYDFGAVRAALIASVPSKQKINSMDSQKHTLWGWPALRDILRHVPLSKSKDAATPHIVTQISSIASLGQTDKWLKDVFFKSLAPNCLLKAPEPTTKPKYSIIFPTPDEIRRSLNGYSSGGSIHMKLQSAPQQKQLQYMRPYLCHWAGDSSDTTTGSSIPDLKREAGRRRAAPHIKTYIRFSDTKTMDSIDWAMVTSSNLSTQAWGAAVNNNGEVRICSWEIGVVVWPQLFATSENQEIAMVPCFKRDTPTVCHTDEDGDGASTSTLIGFRMPYDLPLTPYSPDDIPWCATANHTEPDWLGQTWLE